MKIHSESRIRILFLIMAVLLLITVTVLPAIAQQQTARAAPGFFDFWKLPRIWVGALFCITGLFLLAKSWICHHLRFFFLVIIFFFFGILYILPLGSFARGLSLHPSPLCLIEKPFLFIKAGRGVPVIFLSIVASILVLSIVGNKLFCGWVCPVGALQEIVHRMPLPDRLKKKLPFKITNSIRIAVFLLFLVLLFSAGFSIFGYLNPFEFFHFGFQLIAIVMLMVTLIAALFIFRPFCYFLCPLGLVTWLVEHIAIVKVKVDGDKCTTCNICVEKSPCPTVPSILEGKKLRPDCHPCGRCIEVCPEKALQFKA